MPEATTLEWLPIDAIKPESENPKRHDMRQLEDSIRRFGFINPLVLDRATGNLVAGHGRLKVLKKMRNEGAPPPSQIRISNGTWHVPAIRVSLKDRKESRAYLIADNRLTISGGWDEAGLASLVKSISTEKDGLKGLGFTKLETREFLGKFGDAFTRDAGITYLTSTIRQIVLYYSYDEFQAIRERIDRAVRQAGARNDTELFKAILAHWEKKHADHRSKKKADKSL